MLRNRESGRRDEISPVGSSDKISVGLSETKSPETEAKKLNLRINLKFSGRKFKIFFMGYAPLTGNRLLAEAELYVRV